MKPFWIVRLIKMPRNHCYREGFFPRKVYYKKDAVELKLEVEKYGGEAVVEKEKK